MGGVAQTFGRVVSAIGTAGLTETGLPGTRELRRVLSIGPTAGLSEVDLALQRGRKPAPPPVPSLPSIPGTPDPSSTDVPGVVDRAVKRASQQSRTGGRLSTILTSPLGLTEPALTSRRTLLGR